MLLTVMPKEEDEEVEVVEGEGVGRKRVAVKDAGAEGGVGGTISKEPLVRCRPDPPANPEKMATMQVVLEGVVVEEREGEGAEGEEEEVEEAAAMAIAIMAGTTPRTPKAPHWGVPWWGPWPPVPPCGS